MKDREGERERERERERESQDWAHIVCPRGSCSRWFGSGGKRGRGLGGAEGHRETRDDMVERRTAKMEPPERKQTIRTSRKAKRIKRGKGKLRGGVEKNRMPTQKISSKPRRKREGNARSSANPPENT